MIWKNTAKFTATSIGIACFINTLIQLAYGYGTGTAQGMQVGNMALGILLIGLGYGLPCAIYLNDRIAPWLQVTVAIGTGTIVCALVSWWVGWIPRDNGPWPVVGLIAGIAVVALCIGFICERVYRQTVESVNRALRERNRVSQ